MASDDDEQDASSLVELPIEAELDLHSFAPRDVPALVSDYLTLCRERGLAEVRLIHGRGRGVQRAVVRRVLAGHADVVSYRDAPPQSGFWGATLVQLRTLDRESEGR